MGVKKNFCILPWTHLNFDVSGQTRPCCIYQGRIMKDKTYPFNVEEDNVSDVWNRTKGNLIPFVFGPHFPNLK